MPVARFQNWILEEEEDYLLINKPPMLASLEDRAKDTNLLAMARAYHPEAQLAHRLDKETSGIMIIAKNPNAYRHIALQFENRQVEKVYHAVVEGIHDFNDRKATFALSISSKGLVKVNPEGGKASLTVFRSLGGYKRHTLVEARPVTGRMHQIRIHLAHLGAPIVGDTLYGGSIFYLSGIKRNYKLKKGTDEQPLMTRLALHAYSVAFESTDGSKRMVQAPYPKDMRVLKLQLEKNRY